MERLAKVTGIYRRTDGSHFDAEYFRSVHAGLTVRTLAPLGLIKFECDVAVDDRRDAGGVVAVSNAYFASLAQAQAAVVGAGSVLAADLANYTNIRPVLHFSETAVLVPATA